MRGPVAFEFARVLPPVRSCLVKSRQPAIAFSVFLLIPVRISIHQVLLYQLREVLSLVASLLPSRLMCAEECKAIICLAFWLHGTFYYVGGGSSGFSSAVTGSLLSPPR